MKTLALLFTALATPTIAATPPNVVQPPSPPQQIISQAGSNVVDTLNGTLPFTVTPAANGTWTIHQDGAPDVVFSTHSQIRVAYRGEWPAQQCGPAPPNETRVNACPSGTHAVPPATGWTQTHGWNPAAYPQCWVAQPWTPTTPPVSECAPNGVTPPGNLMPVLDQAELLPFDKPDRGAPFVTQYGTIETRVTDHAVDRPGSQFVRNDYSRRQAFNSDMSRIVAYQGGGAWLVYDANTFAFVKALNGPGGDAEVQWSPTDPDKLYFMANNGGTSIYALTVSTNTYVETYNFRNQVFAALGSLADRCWTRSEGSPSSDNTRWGFICQHYNQSTGNFDTQGYIVLDIVAHQVLWSQPANGSDYVDHVSMTPSGRYFVISGSQERALRVADGAFCTLRQNGEHSDIAVLPGGHDGLFTFDYGDGTAFYIDIDSCFDNPSNLPQRHEIFEIYSNPLWGTVPGDCMSRCSFHVSGKAFDRPGWIVYSNEGTQLTSLVAYDVNTNQLYGLGVLMDNVPDYWAEPQVTVSRDGRSILFNDQFGDGINVDDYRIDIDLP